MVKLEVTSFRKVGELAYEKTIKIWSS